MKSMYNLILEIVQSPAKGLVTTITGLLLGYTPSVFSNNNDTTTIKSLVEHTMSTGTAFQYAVWTITILVGLCTITNFIQKQYDRYRTNKRRKFINHLKEEKTNEES